MSELFGQRQKQSLFVLVFMVGGLIYMSTRSDDSPQRQVRAAIEAMVVGAESKNLNPFKEHLSEDVRDEKGHNKTDILNVLRVLFLRHNKISLNLLDLDVDDNTNPDVMTASLTLLMGESVVPTDKGNFFLTFRIEEDRWRVWEIKWDGGYGY